jgi:hypothetical protein
LSVFKRHGGAFVATTHSAGPWDPRSQHGGAPAALLTRELQALAPELRVARATFELLGPVPVGPVEVRAAVVKPGRRFRLAEAELAVDGRVVVRARAVLLRRAAVTEPTGERPLPCPPPDALEPVRFPSSGEGFHLTAMELRDAGGTWAGAGAARTWFRLRRELVAGEGPATGAALAAAVADFGNGTSFVLPFDGWLFVNTDLTVHLHRDPEGPWVLLEARTTIGPDGAGLASSALYDERGEVGLAAQSLYVDRR